MNNNSNYTIVGPAILKWVSSQKPRPGKFGNKYECSIVFDKEKATEFNARFLPALEEFKKLKIAEFGDKFIAAFKIKQPFYEETDEDGNKTGMWIAKATRREFRGDDTETPNNPKVVDANKQPILDTEIANGSEGLMVVIARPWALTIEHKTISMPLWLEVIQVTKLIAYTQGSDPLAVL